MAALQRQLLQYASQVLGRYEPNQEQLDFIYSLLPLKSHDELPPSDLNAVLRSQIDVELADPDQDKLADCPEAREVQEVFCLDEHALELILFCYCCAQHVPFADYCSFIPKSESFRFLALCTGLEPSQLNRLLSPRGPLLGPEILESNLHDGWCLQLSPELVGFLAGIAGRSLAELYCRRVSASTYPLDSFPIPPIDLYILNSLLSATEPANILLYGPTGTGKTELARSLVAYCHKELWELDAEAESSRWPLLALRSASRSIRPIRAVLVVDESDRLLNSGYSFRTHVKAPEKGALNRLLDSSCAQIIWIANDVSFADRSILRRFSHSICLRGLSPAQREQRWTARIRMHVHRRILPDELARRLARRYNSNAAGIAGVLAVIGCVPRDQLTEARAEGLLERLLSQQTFLANGRLPKARDFGELFDPGALNIDVEADALSLSLRQFMELRNSYPERPSPGVKLLFWGPPGTGKTAFSYYLSSCLDRSLFARKASDLLSSWVGETERNIADAFHQAESEENILLFDEADSLLRSRENALRGWEVTQVNEMLTQMETFSGILICSTNRLDDLDPAVLRRFTWKVQFHPLAAAQANLLFHRYFPGAELAPVDTQRLEKIPELTAGDFATVAEQARCAALQNADNRTGQDLVSALEREASYRTRKISGRMGFIEN